MTKTQKQEKALRAELIELNRRSRAILAGRYAPWGFPWCAGPGSPYHQPPACEGCAGRLMLAGQAAALAPRIAQLKAMLAPAPAQGALFP
jgi:hypothetical protein